jgi:thiol:disulfide interchange protein DsbA
VSGRAFAALLFAFVAPFAAAQPAPKGPGFELVEPAQPTSAPAGQIEVIEVFNHTCVHCYDFQPMVNAWVKSKPANVKFTYLAAPLGGPFDVFARGYFAAEALGMADKVHQGVFDAVFKEKVQIRTIEELAAVYEKLGVPRADFLAAASSFAVNARMKQTAQMLTRYDALSTPTILVAGKYRVNGQTAGGYPNVFTVVNQLVATETAASAAH